MAEEEKKKENRLGEGRRGCQRYVCVCVYIYVSVYLCACLCVCVYRYIMCV